MNNMFSCLLLVSFFFLLTAPAAEPVCQRADWQLVFEDDFSGAELDRAKWGLIEYEKGYARVKDIPDWRRHQSQDAGLVELNRAGRERTCGAALPASQAEGVLTLWGKQGSHFHNALKEAGFLDLDAMTYACGGITTQQTFAFQYGYVEVRARFDCANGVWPAIWMKPLDNENWPRNGEIDIMEHLNDESTVYQTLHYLANDGKRKITGKGVSSRKWVEKDAKTDWHVYGMLWEKGRISFFVDGVQTGSFNSADSLNWPFDRQNNRFYLMIDQQVGGAWVQGALGGRALADLTASPAALEIDYVRVYSSESLCHPATAAPAAQE